MATRELHPLPQAIWIGLLLLALVWPNQLTGSLVLAAFLVEYGYL